jgi:predicted membrane protein
LIDGKGSEPVIQWPPGNQSLAASRLDSDTEEKMKLRVITLSMLAIAALGFTIQASAQEEPQTARDAHQGTLTEFDAPGASTAPGLGTQAFANNDLGEVVGVYTDTNVVPHGFIRAFDGKITSFDAPGAGLGAGLDQGTEAFSVNDFGVIAGQFADPSNVFHAFIRFPNGAFTTFDAPGAGTGANQGTLAYNLNPQGATAGIYFDESNGEHGFARSPSGKVTTFDAPDGIGVTFVCEETCLNPQGAIVGDYTDADGVGHGFVREPDGKITEFSAPGAGTGARPAAGPARP